MEKPTRSPEAAAWAMLLCALPLTPQTAAIPQQLQHESVVVNIEVPVRVFRKNAFVDGLTMRDFEVYEDGVKQPIEAVYLVKNRKVEREEKASPAAPPPPQAFRNFVLYLDLKEYLPKAGDALDYFFSEVIAPGDSLSVVTPAKSYRFKPEAFSRLNREQIAEGLKSKLKADIQAGHSGYRNLMKDFYKLEETPFPPEMADLKEWMLFDIARQIKDLMEMPESRLKDFADTLKTLAGEKHVFLIFQKDVLPDHEFSWDRQTELFKPVAFDLEKIKRLYSDASITIHFTYITKTPSFALSEASLRRPSLEFRQPDLSSDLFASFREMAKATGGLTESTSNPDFGLRKAAEASNNYYLLCYRPLSYKADGGFRKIEVRVKGSGLSVTYRMGYIAD